MSISELEQSIASYFVGSADAYDFDEVMKSFSYHTQQELYDSIFSSFEEYLQYKDNYHNNYYDFNGDLFYQIKSFASQHLYKEGYNELSDFVDENIEVHYNYSWSSFDYSTETKEKFEEMLKKEFPNSEWYRHYIFNDECLTYLVEAMEINIDNFPVEELDF